MPGGEPACVPPLQLCITHNSWEPNRSSFRVGDWSLEEQGNRLLPRTRLFRPAENGSHRIGFQTEGMSQRTLSIATLDYPDYRDCGKEFEQKDPVSRLEKVVGNAQPFARGEVLVFLALPLFPKGELVESFLCKDATLK